MNLRRPAFQFLLFITGIQAMLLAAALISRNPALITLVIIVLLLILVTGGLFALRTYRDQQAGEKAKRGQNADVYMLIDRLVNELNADELAYLRNRLDEVEHVRDSEATTTLEALLERHDDQQASSR